ncbi:MAG TPA: hypothetical protein VGQ42_13035 [Candidatus Dormibacteraeota bacterium]|jgi:dienelactone hydrolase|nr:hypothetical protein [Candidatus Dormibacteraeota bacterium]
MEVPRNKLELRDDPTVLSPPILTQPLYACAKAVNVTGYVPGATLDIEVAGAVVVAGFAAGSPAPFGAIIHLPAPLVAGQAVRARQSYGSATSPWAAAATVVDHTVDYPAGPPRPELFPTPLYNCGVRTGVGNLLVGCDTWITADGATAGSVAGANNPQGVNVAPAYSTNQTVRAWAQLCDDPSPPSQKHQVQPPPLPLPAPGFDPIYQGGTQLVVNSIADGAHFTLSRNGIAVGTLSCWGGKCIVGLSPAFVTTDTLTATQELCPGDGPSPPGTGQVLPCSSLPAPQVAPVQDGATQVTLTAFVLGSEIKVFVNNVKTGDGSGPVVALIGPVPHGATVDVWQILGTCQGSTVQQLTSHCVAPPTGGDPSAVDLFPVGTHDYDDGQVSFDGFTYNVRGSIYYPADDDGADQPFNTRLARLGPAPLVVCVHGAHDPAFPSYRGYDYFQAALARMGFVVVSVDENQTNEKPDWGGWTQNIVRRAELGLASIAYLQTLNANGPIFKGAIDFSRTGLMGHSRGAECVIAMAERNTLAGVAIRSVLSLAPVNSGATSGRPKGYAFMTFLPAADGDVVDNNGAQFYDQATPDSIKVQLYIDHANHNFFNRQWFNDDAHRTNPLRVLPIMSRPDHERILLAYGCAFFRFILQNGATLPYLIDQLLPAGALTDNVHMAYAVQGLRVVDDYENHPITVDSEGQATAQLGGITAGDYPFAQAGGAFNSSFFGNTTGNVMTAHERAGDFREPLKSPVDLRRMEVRVRAAEVYQAPNIPATATGFRVGVEDGTGTIAWVDVDDVGGLSRPFDRRAFDALTKTMLSTFRFPDHCFGANSKLDLAHIVAIHLGLDRGDGRPIAFDDLQIAPA